MATLAEILLIAHELGESARSQAPMPLDRESILERVRGHVEIPEGIVLLRQEQIISAFVRGAEGVTLRPLSKTRSLPQKVSLPERNPSLPDVLRAARELGRERYAKKPQSDPNADLAFNLLATRFKLSKSFRRANRSAVHAAFAEAWGDIPQRSVRADARITAKASPPDPRASIRFREMERTVSYRGKEIVVSPSLLTAIHQVQHFEKQLKDARAWLVILLDQAALGLSAAAAGCRRNTTKKKKRSRSTFVPDQPRKRRRSEPAMPPPIHRLVSLPRQNYGDDT